MAVVERLCEPISLDGARRDLALETDTSHIYLHIDIHMDIDIDIASHQFAEFTICNHSPAILNTGVTISISISISVSIQYK